MKRLLISLIIILSLWALNLPAPLCAQPKLVFSAVDNETLSGVISEILSQAYQQLGIEISVIDMPAKRALRSSNAGQTDGEAFRIAGIAQDYPNLIRIDVPLHTNPIFLYVRADHEFPVNGWQSIPDNYVMGYIRGIKFAEYAVEKYGIKTESDNSRELLFQQLDRGVIDVFLSGSDNASSIIDKFELANIVKLEPLIHSLSLYHYLHQKHRNLVPEITRVLQEMQADGRIQQINEQFQLNRR